MHYHVAFREGSNQVSVLTSHHTYREKAAALSAAQRLIGPGVHHALVHGNITRFPRTGNGSVDVTVCHNPSCMRE